LTPTSASRNDFKTLLKDWGFLAFLGTQFLGALNDNLYKYIVSLRAVHVAANGGTEYLSLAGAVYVIPFLLFSGYSGHLADQFSKRTVMIWVKAFEILAMSIGFAAFFTSSIELMLLVLFLMALHSTIFSPAKYGIVPEMLPSEQLSRANALLEMTTFVAIVIGTAFGAFLYASYADTPWKMGVVLMAVAVVGLLMSFRMRNTGAVGATDKFSWNPFGEVIKGTVQMWRDKPLWYTVMAISYFWMLGALFQLDLLLYGSEVLKVDDLKVGLMVTALAIGIGVGSLLAGKLSGNRVDLGLVPVGSVFMGLTSMGLYAAKHSYAWSVVALIGLGLSSGLFIVPLNAYLQYRSGHNEKGRAIATNNFYNTVGLLIASGVLWLFHDTLHYSPATLILASGIFTLVATLYIIWMTPDHLGRLTARVLLWIFFRVRIVGAENIPPKGGGLLVSNHMSYLDGFLIGCATERRIRFMVWKPFFNNPILGRFLRLFKAIPVATDGLRGLKAAVEGARSEIEKGHLVCIFPEGSISRTGGLLPFKRGMERMVGGLDACVIPVHLDRLWGSIFSFKGGLFLKKRPERVPYPVTVSFGALMPASTTALQARQAVSELASDAAALRVEQHESLASRFVNTARKHWNSTAMADSSGTEVTFGKALAGAVLFSDWTKANSVKNEKIGLLFPASVGAALANIGVTLAGRVPVNLNFTVGKETMASAIAQCQIRVILTSKVFVEKAKLEPLPGTVFVEDVMKGVNKTAAYLRARVAPKGSLYERGDADSVATIIFSSGSTGTPKGVMLSHRNVITNIESVLQMFPLTHEDRIIGVLPFFHSFGFTITLWLPALMGCGALYHANPTDAKAIGELVQKYKGSFLLGTPTFLATYTRKCTKEQFATLKYVLAGAEKVRESVSQAFHEAFGVLILEGYGCTEMAPVVAVNRPDWGEGRDSQTGHKPGSVGHPIPNVAARVVNPETLEVLGPNQEGLLLVRGPNRMIGYLNQPEKTAEALTGGWYKTGDIAIIDDDGFIRITDRLARFSKIGGEMVPHGKIEETTHALIEGISCVVTSIADEKKGERLAMLYCSCAMEPAEIWKKLAESELPKLWIPKQSSIHRVDELPVLGTGKMDLRKARTMAEELSKETPAKEDVSVA
jgi:acyl-[acyl-carrier-protein]-phospholipid O-acyltransferase/long-chain-fatty-acid--[acyl-carrier-protein] ligase